MFCYSLNKTGQIEKKMSEKKKDDADNESRVHQDHLLEPQSNSFRDKGEKNEPPTDTTKFYEKERHLISLLSKAATEIRAERRKVKDLVAENKEIKQKLSEAQRNSPSSARSRSRDEGHSSKTAAMTYTQSVNAQLSKERDELKIDRQRALSTIEAQSSEIRALKEQIAELKQRCREQQRLLTQRDGLKTITGTRSQSVGRGFSSYADRDAARRHACMNHTSGIKLESQQIPNITTEKNVASPESAPEITSTPLRGQAQTEGIKNRSLSAEPRVSMQTVESAARSTSVVKKKKKIVLNDAAAAEAAAAAAEKEYNELMLNRLRRAVAPPPTKAQIAAVVDAMMNELCSRLHQHNAKLPAAKVGPAVYQLGSGANHKMRVVHLAVDSGRLVVKSGGGHIDLLEYIERHKLCISM